MVSFIVMLVFGQVSFMIINMFIDVDSYSWDFGNGDVFMEENLSVMYIEVGMYIIMLIVINECGSSIVIQEVEVIFLVEFFFMVIEMEGCVFFMIIFMVVL